MFLFFVLNLVVSAQDIKVLSSDQSSIVIEYRPIYRDTTTVNSQGQQFTKITLLGGYVENFPKQGQAQLQVRAINIGVPAEFGNVIQILSQDYSNISGKYLPNPKLIKDSVSYSPQYAEADGYTTSNYRDAVTFGEFGFARNFPIQTVKIYPVQYDGSTNTIKLLKKIVFRISYAPVPSNLELLKDNMFESVVLNWNVAKNWGVAEKRISKVSASILSTGDWFRFETPEEGIYKIDRNFLQALGVDVNTVDPRTIKIYGYGGAALPEDLQISNNKGLIENAIKVIGEEDGKFDATDYILFYGRPAEFWEYDKTQKSILRVKNPFSKKNYYWLTYGGTTNGKRIADKQSLGSATYQQQTTLAFKTLDDDKTNKWKSGRDYLGDLFDADTKSRTYINTLNGIVPSSRVNYKIRTVNASSPDIQLKVEENSNQILSTNLAGFGVSANIYGIENISTTQYSGGIPDERSALKFTIISGDASANVYLDYLEITYQRQLKSVGDNLLFFSKDTTASIEYTLSNFSTSSIQTFDVTDFANVKIVSNPNISGGQFKFQANEKEKSASKYLALTPSAYKTPANGTKVVNSSIRGNVGGSEMIIITAKDFKAQAERYANYRSAQSPYKLSTQIFYVDEILNEFSGGVLDPTAIRDFLKYAYETWQIKPFYVLLFGDGDYDYLNIENQNRNFVPVYETAESLNEILAYPTDDYYARVAGTDERADLAIGRLNVQTTQQADSVISKIIKYETNPDKGLWQNTISLVADDGFSGKNWDGSIFTSHTETLCKYYIPQNFDFNKIYLAAYPTVFTGLGRRKPGVNQAIIDAVNNGTLMLNYIGHGNPSLWAHENVFEKSVSIPQLKNDKYFFLTAATCDFGKYDDPDEQSSTELLVALNGAGAIGALSASRVVYDANNVALNDTFYTHLFFDKDNGLPVRTGRAYYMTKQFLHDANDEKFHLFGDPALRLDIPHLQAKIDSVNGKGLQNIVQVNALGGVKIKGSVRNSNGSINPFNGEAIVSVFDSERSLELKEMNYTATLQGGLIYRGRVTVTNGQYQTEFVVPKDISYENKNGKIVSYIVGANNDGIGYTNNILVGGTNPNAVNDGKGPEISIYFDDINFQSSYLVNPNFTLIAKLSDQTGLNTTGTGIGHKLQAVLNGDEANAIDLTNSFVGDLNSGGKSGIIKYRFSNVTPGDYKIKIKAWDVFNNSSTQEAAFTVVSSDKGIVLRDVVNYPNPFSSNTTFTFQHNLSSSFNVKIKVYTVAGRLIKQIENWNLFDKFVKIDWDGRDEDGNQIANGTYLYKLIVESIDGQFKENVLGKLAVIR